MKLRDALELIREHRPSGTGAARYVLACSSTSAHLLTFLHASLLAAQPALRISVESTLYGDLQGSLERFDAQGCAGLAIACEWYDLDPRLGYRRLGGWTPGLFDEIVAGVAGSFARLRQAVEKLPSRCPW